VPLTNGGLQQCGTSSAYCDLSTCLAAFSRPGSNCAATPADPYIPFIPNIDVCGHAQGGVSCPKAGAPPNSHEPGYYYRCCSAAGHCGSKNNIEEQSLYCGTGCQAGFGDCSTNRVLPPLPAGPATTVRNGETCGPIVNAKCTSGLCCSGSNICGTGAAFCGAADWCQPQWGVCS